MRFLIGLLTVYLCLAISCPSIAKSSEARKTLETSVTRIMDYIKNPGYSDQATRVELNKQIEKEVYKTFDFTEFSMRTVGQRWKTLSHIQQEEFTKAFADLLFSTYLDRMDGYSGESIIYTGEVSNKSGSRVEVRTIVTITGNRTIPVAYRMLTKNNSWYVYDVIIEGISLVKNYRTQFGNILTKESPEVLVARIRERGTALRNKPYDNSN